MCRHFLNHIFKSCSFIDYDMLFRKPNLIPFLLLVGAAGRGGGQGAVVVQWLSRVLLFPTPRTVAHKASWSFTISQSLLILRAFNHLILSFCPLLFLPSIFPSIRVFSSESVLHIRWPKDWSFSFSINPCFHFRGHGFLPCWGN